MIQFVRKGEGLQPSSRARRLGEVSQRHNMLRLPPMQREWAIYRLWF